MTKIAIRRVVPLEILDPCLVIKPDDILLVEKDKITRPSIKQLRARGLEDALDLSSLLGPDYGSYDEQERAWEDGGTEGAYAHRKDARREKV